ncbi:S8 family serine peptidase [Streptomyces sp. NPDC002838]|uniref:S8 family serine peptidase n=1 Tax=Streptomyces sp. NPDC002838 TaxID=3154436 RepID=UPI00331A18FC
MASDDLPGAYVDMVAALNQAVADGVDVINFSIGGYGVLGGTLELAMLNAAKAGVFISAAAGNEGPDSVSHLAPWGTTVAASTHDTGYRTTLTLGNGTSRTGVGVVASAAPSAPLVDAARAARSGVAADDAERCLPGTPDPEKVTGAIVLCEHIFGDSREGKADQVEEADGVGMVLHNVAAPVDTAFAFRQAVPTVYLTSGQAEAVKAYAARAGSRATAKLSAARAVSQRAPEVVRFSSGGPGPLHGGVLKPDITAPGLDTIAGTARDSEFAKGAQGLMSGTSSSAPQVAGLALVLRGLHPDWSPAEVKSALMTTATTTDNKGRPIRRSGAEATKRVGRHSADVPGPGCRARSCRTSHAVRVWWPCACCPGRDWPLRPGANSVKGWKGRGVPLPPIPEIPMVPPVRPEVR